MAPDDDKPAPSDTNDRPDPTVKQLLERDLGKPLEEVVDAVTAAELQRWFGLPSFEQVAEDEARRAPRPEDPEMIAARERRAAAVAAVDPALLESLRFRAESMWDLLEFEAVIDVRVDPTVALFDQSMVDRLQIVAEPREVERPEDIEDQLKDATPQALLRDLHRAELYFEKSFDRIDMAAEQTLDIVAEVRLAMRTSWKLPTLGDPVAVELRRLFADIRTEWTQPWANLPKRANLPNRRVND